MEFGIVMTDNVVNNKILNIPNLVNGHLESNEQVGRTI